MSAAKNVKGEPAHRVPGHGGELPDTLLPHAALQIKDRGPLPAVWIGDGRFPLADYAGV